MGGEAEPQITPAAVSKRVMVIGGGIAGMEAARVAALRGHQVTLYERESQLGGQLQIAAKAPGRAEMAEPVRYYTKQFDLLEVPVHLGVAVDEKLLRREKPDAVIVATGGLPALLGVDGIDEDGKAEGVNVVLAWDVLDGTAEVRGNKVAVFATDQGMEGLTTADFLAERGKEVEVLIPNRACCDEGMEAPLQVRPAIRMVKVEDGPADGFLLRVPGGKRECVVALNDFAGFGVHGREHIGGVVI